MKFSNPLKNERGAALVIALMFLAIVAMMGATAVILTTTDIQIGSNYKESTISFNYAEAGISYAITGMEAGLADGSFSLPTSTDPTDPNNSTTLTYTLPSGFNFSISEITMNGPNAYSFTSNGTGTDNAQSIIRVTFKRDSAISYAAFGDKKLDTKNSGTTISYNSGSSDPTHNNPSAPSFQSTHEADVGSNDWLVTHNGAMIDGSGVLGEKPDGSATTNSIHGGTTFNDTYNTTPVNAGRIDPDPLGVNSGGEYDPTTYSAVGDNDNLTHAAPPIAGNSISTNSTVTLTGKAGGSNFYLTSVTLKNGSVLYIDTTLGEVNIFLSGPFDAKNGSSIVLTPNPLDTTKFSIFSNSTSKIDLKHSSTFAGLIYAPYAPIDVKNSAAAYGAIWGSNVDIKNTGTLYFDSALRDKFLSNNLTKTTWQHVQN